MNIWRLTGVRVGLVEQLRARVQVSEGSDAQTVGGVKLRLEELTTNLTHVRQLQEAGGRQQNLTQESTSMQQELRIKRTINPRNDCGDELTPRSARLFISYQSVRPQSLRRT